MEQSAGSWLVSRSKRNGWLPMNRRIDQKARGAEIQQPLNPIVRRETPLRRPAGERAGSELARARPEPGEVEQSAGSWRSCPVSRSKRNGWLPMNRSFGARIPPTRDPQRAESAAHERTLRRRLRLAPLRAESRLKARGLSEQSGAPPSSAAATLARLARPDSPRPNARPVSNWSRPADIRATDHRDRVRR